MRRNAKDLDIRIPHISSVLAKQEKSYFWNNQSHVKKHILDVLSLSGSLAYDYPPICDRRHEFSKLAKEEATDVCSDHLESVHDMSYQQFTENTFAQWFRFAIEFCQANALLSMTCHGYDPRCPSFLQLIIAQNMLSQK